MLPAQLAAPARPGLLLAQASEAREQMMVLERVVGLDDYLGSIDYPYSNEMLDRLLSSIL